MKKARDLLKRVNKTNTVRTTTSLFSTTASIASTATTIPSQAFLQMDPSERYRYNPTLQWNPEVEEYFVRAYGLDHFSRISKALTQPSSYSCIRVNTLKSSTDEVIEKLLAVMTESGYKDYSQADNGQNENAANQLGQSIGREPILKCKIPGLDYVLFVKGSGPQAIDYGYAPGAPLKEIIVSRKCAEAVLRGAQVFVPGVMACSGHVEKGDLVAVSAATEQHGPDGGWAIGITRGTVLQGDQTDPYFSERKGLYIGHGMTMMSRAGIFRVPEGIAVDMTQRIYNLPSFHNVLEGEIFLQNLPSIIAAHALDPQKGERILDMCAAPGGKTTAIAMLMKDQGEVVAVDRSHNKVLDINKLAAEMGLTCITTYKLDALKAVSRGNELNGVPVVQSSDSVRITEKMPFSFAEVLHAEKKCEKQVGTRKENDGTYVSKADIRKANRRMRNGPGRNQSLGGRVENSKGFAPHSFDRVLLDAPCSALGLRPRLFAGEETIKSLRNHGMYQKRMVDQAVQLVRPGGVLVYSTCTINPAENEAVVRYALDKYKFLSLAPQHPRIGGPGLVGSCEFPDGYTERWLRPGEEDLVQRFDPSSSLDTIGFFIAKFVVGSKEA